jgi:hypothetical protein
VTPVVDEFLRRVMRWSFRRTLAGEPWSWAVLAAGIFVLRRARRPEPHGVVQLRRGDTLLIGSADAVGPRD